MCADPSKPTPVLVTPDTPHSYMHDLWHSPKEPEQTSRQSQASDPESQCEKATQPEKQHKLDLSHYKIVNEVWHYSSIDWGHKCECTPLWPRLHRLIKSSPLCGLQLLVQYKHRERTAQVCQTKPSRRQAAMDLADTL